MNNPEHIEFCDLSSELDRFLSFLIYLSENSSSNVTSAESAGYGDFLSDYLGKRAALEHVFFNRYLGGSTWDELKLKAEIWRIRKIRAKSLMSRSDSKTNRRQSGRASPRR